MQQQQILDRYRHLRVIGNRHLQGALDCLVQPAIMERARHLGLTSEGSEQEAALVYDLAVHTARRGRSRAIDRYARLAVCADRDETRTLDALRQARFSIWRIARRHDVAGLVLEDLMRQGETWLIDQNLTASVAPGMVLASRLYCPDDFAITCGVLVPLSAELLQEALLQAEFWASNRQVHDVADDPRFAVAIYRTAVTQRTMEHVRFRPVDATA